MRKDWKRTALAIALWLTAWMLPAQDTVVDSRLSSRRFTTLDGLPQMQAETVWQDSEGYVWIGTLSGFARYDGRQLVPYMKGRRENIVRFTQVDSAREGRFVALNFRRLHYIDEGNIETRKIDEGWHWLLNNLNGTDLPEGIIMLEDEQESHRMLCRLTADGWAPLLKCEVMDRMTPDRKLYIDGQDLYVPTDGGLYLVRDGQPRLLTDKDDIYTLRRVGHTLYVLAGDGIYTLAGDKLTLRQAYHFAAPDYGLYVRHNQEGQLYIADSHTLYLYDGEKVSVLADGYNMVKALFTDRWDRLWMATYQGVYLFFRADFTEHRLSDGNDIVRALATDPQGHIVMGTLNGQVIADGQTLPARRDNDFFQPSAATIGGAVYMAGHGDVARIAGGEVEWLGLPPDRYQFVAAADGHLIIGTRQQILTYDPGTQRLDTLMTDVPPHAWCAAADHDGRLWVGGSAGLLRIDHWRKDAPPHQTSRPAAPEATKVDYPQRLVISNMVSDAHGHVLFTSCDSLFLIRHGEVLPLNAYLPLLDGHEVRSLHVSPRGYLIVATLDGLLVSRIDDDGTPHDGRWYDHRNGFTLIEPQSAMMAEQADGRIWVAGTEAMMSFYPGRLLAFDERSTIVELPRPWWQHWWVWLAALAVVAGASWFWARQYERRRQRNHMLRLEREKRQKELQISAFRLKSIPHFHANVLAGIEYFLMNNSTDEAIDYLKVYSDFTNQTLTDIDRPSRSVAEETDYIRNYLELEKLRYGDRLQYNISIADGVNPQWQIPTMALFTYCQNAVKHGIGNKAGGGRVDVTIALRDDRLVLTVKDDGVGRTKAEQLNTHSTKQGLHILHEQIALYNQTNSTPITETVTDLHDEHGQATGTCFELQVPVDYAFLFHK